MVNKFYDIDLPGIKDEVTLQIDSLLIPHIYAKNDEDLYYVQGYMHAFHRLWQMEFQIMSTSGRLSEILVKEHFQGTENQEEKVFYMLQKIL